MRCTASWLGLSAVALVVVACSGSTEQGPGSSGGAAGTSGTGATAGGSGAGGTINKGGAGGGTGGLAGQGGTGAGGGTGGIAGQGGTVTTGGTAGTSGAGAGGAPDAGTCPGMVPAGQSCNFEGQQCEYPSGCSTPTPCLCNNGTWLCAQVGCIDAGPAPCPVSLPSGNCNKEGQQCTYGDDPRPNCRNQASCYQGQWLVMTPKCEGPSSTCPADPNNPPDGVCFVGTSMFCTYGPGSACDCEWGGGVPDPDGGWMQQWTCWGPPGNNCPDNAPNAGQPCSVDPTLQCQYGPTCSSLIMACEMNYWAILGHSACI